VLQRLGVVSDNINILNLKNKTKREKRKKRKKEEYLGTRKQRKKTESKFTLV
jgi:hypothetical protein